MEIYFAGSIRGGREDAELYQKLITYIQKYAAVLTEHVGDPTLRASHGESLDPHYIHERDLRWLKQADAVIAEVSTPSLGVGYEIAQAICMKKDVLCLYNPKSWKRLSAMIAGCPGIKIVEYGTFEEAKQAIDLFLRGSKDENHGE